MLEIRFTLNHRLPIFSHPFTDRSAHTKTCHYDFIFHVLTQTQIKEAVYATVGFSKNRVKLILTPSSSSKALINRTARSEFPPFSKKFDSGNVTEVANSFENR